MSKVSGNLKGYVVQAKSKFFPALVNDQIFVDQWMRVIFTQVPANLGIGIVETTNGVLKHIHLMDYNSAQALRWWFMANDRSRCLETRIMSHKVSYEIDYEESEPLDELPAWPEIASRATRLDEEANQKGEG